MMKGGLSWFILTIVLGYCLAYDNAAELFGNLGCFGDYQCPNSMACIVGNCSNPCEVLCGYNTSCTVFNHVPACACKEGHTGNPFDGCAPQDILECVSNDDCATDKACAKHQCVDPCAGVCGKNTVCYVINHVATCSCRHSGHPILGCSASTDVLGDSGCSSQDQCPASKACVSGKCINPCEILCGENTLCNVINHVPACTCKVGYTGNPFTGCAPQDVWPPKTGKKTFYLQHSNMTDWHTAFMLCMSPISRLASIDNEQEFQEIKKLLVPSVDSHWTSGSDAGNEGNFMWATTGRHFSSTSNMWQLHLKQPNNYNNSEHCVELRFLENEGYGLNDQACESKRYSVCEYYK